MMGDVQFVTGSHVSKTTMTLGRGSPSKETPVFTLPPRNTRVCQGGTARLEGKVREILHNHPDPDPQLILSIVIKQTLCLPMNFIQDSQQ